MNRFGEFGQLMALIDYANQTQYLAASTLIEQKRLKGEQKLSERELQQQEKLSKLDLEFRYKELAKKEQHSSRRDELFKDIALYAGIGLGTLVILITVGVMFVGAKREAKYEYIVEEDE